jgi:Na+-transporting NADH:ubiquinone oxidoreductase subunit NqrD
MFTDIQTSLSPIINLSNVSIAESLVHASTCERVSITLDHIPESMEMVIPVRIIEGMERVIDRGTVSQKQLVLI